MDAISTADPRDSTWYLGSHLAPLKLGREGRGQGAESGRHRTPAVGQESPRTFRQLFSPEGEVITPTSLWENLASVT